MDAGISTGKDTTEPTSTHETPAALPHPARPGPLETATGAAARRPIRIMGRRSTAAALVAGAVLNASASYINTAFLQGGPTVEGYVNALSERGALGLFGVLLNILGIPMMLAGIVGLLQLGSPKSPVASRIALAATVVGMVAFLCMNGALAALYSMGTGGHAEVVAQQLTGTSAGMLAMLLPFLLGNAVGMVGAAVALFRSKVTAPWIPATLLMFFVADFFLPAVPLFDAHLLFVAFATGAALAVLRAGRQPFSG
ncbi:hypothetical protein JOF48_000744 [Arthrobacter stackebrandtii]|uniref:DUF4386 family protein n=1 Tax=Arthrobacter stackebrandtii TaxID=272161 RepID=A0ABS4YTL8_9MICC|nr:hypothetical protein [Arthrobacter stackebrandtii]MBP2411945.1 hypothetical protein [Arthrobacter stackebrandtii]PYG99797.1 hypothetical protein CVV67_13640 [Arthrobacter stackebrandtii]